VRRWLRGINTITQHRSNEETAGGARRAARWT